MVVLGYCTKKWLRLGKGQGDYNDPFEKGTA